MTPAERPTARGTGVAAAGASLAIVATLVGMQYWLLTAALEASMAGEAGVALPAFLASGAILAMAAGLVWTIERIQRAS
jgi:hypothetical protein